MEEHAGKVYVPPRGTRGSWFRGVVLIRLLRPLYRRQVAHFAKAKGPEQPTFIGHPVLLLTTIGAKTGRERLNALHSFPDGEDSWLVVAAKFGAADHPGWFYNLAKNPDEVWVQVGNRRFRAEVETLQSAEREEACARLAKAGASIADLQKKTDRQIPVVRVRTASSES